MEQLSAEMCAAMGLAEGTTVHQLIQHMAGGGDSLDGLLTTDQARASAEATLVTRDSYQLHVIPQMGMRQERYCAIQLQGIAEPVHVGLLAEQPSAYLPSDLENLVLWAVVNPVLPWHSAWRDLGAGKVNDWRNAGAGQAIIAAPLSMPLDGLRVICGLFDLQHAEIGSAAAVPALVASTASISVNAPVASITVVQARLLREAAAVSQPKWRCLSLYRILENAYLNNIKQLLLAEFDADASRALDSARKKVSSELQQLIALAEEADLRTEFEVLNTEFDGLKAANNHFITMLDRGAATDPVYAQELYKKGVLRFYKLRCSIAHAGTSSVIYEQFPDSDLAATSLLPTIERIALKSLKVAL